MVFEINIGIRYRVSSGRLCENENEIRVYVPNTMRRRLMARVRDETKKKPIIDGAVFSGRRVGNSRGPAGGLAHVAVPYTSGDRESARPPGAAENARWAASSSLSWRARTRNTKESPRRTRIRTHTHAY